MTTIRELQVTFDCAEPARVARFWCEVLGYVLPEDYEDDPAWAACADPTGAGPRLYFQRVPEDKVAKNRVHLDVRAAPDLEGEERMAALERESERLVARGATRLRRFEPAPPMEQGFLVMADPEGNEFCLD